MHSFPTSDRLLFVGLYLYPHPPSVTLLCLALYLRIFIFAVLSIDCSPLRIFATEVRGKSTYYVCRHSRHKGLPGGAVVKGAVLQRQLFHQRLWVRA